jgi:hypothetical protein
MTVAALPFPSAVLGRSANERAAVVLYASSMAVVASLLTMLSFVAQCRHLLSPGTASVGIRQGLWRSGSMAAVFAL